jgi:cytochrome c
LRIAMEQQRKPIRSRRHLACLLAVLVSGCTSEKSNNLSDADTAAVADSAAFAEQIVLSNREYLEQDGYAAADSEWGERLAMQCQACHALEKNGPTLLGPTLYGVFGRDAGSLPGFDYSPVLASATFIWTPAALDAWLAAPSQFLPGNRMAFAGIQNDADRNALIAYLLQVSDESNQVGAADAQ